VAGAERRQEKEAASANEERRSRDQSRPQTYWLAMPEAASDTSGELELRVIRRSRLVTSVGCKKVPRIGRRVQAARRALYSPPAPDFCSATESRETNWTLHNATGPVRNDLHAQPLSMSGCVCVARCTGCFSIFLRIILGTTATTCVTSVVLGHVFL